MKKLFKIRMRKTHILHSTEASSLQKGQVKIVSGRGRGAFFMTTFLDLLPPIMKNLQDQMVVYKLWKFFFSNPSLKKFNDGLCVLFLRQRNLEIWNQALLDKTQKLKTDINLTLL